MNKLDQLKQIPLKDLQTLIQGSAFLFKGKPEPEKPHTEPKKKRTSRKKILSGI